MLPPEDVRTAITSVDLRNKLRSVAEKHRLHVDQAGALENETMLVMLGLEHPRDYIQNLERKRRSLRPRPAVLPKTSIRKSSGKCANL